MIATDRKWGASGSDLNSALSATALAVTATLSSSAPVLNRLEPIMASPVLSRPIVTAAHPGNHQKFLYTMGSLDLLSATESVELAGLSLDQSSWTGFGSETAATSPTLVSNVLRVGTSFAPPRFLDSGALQLYDSIVESAKSPLLKYIIFFSYSNGCPIPAIEVIEDGVTIDYSQPGRLLSVLLEKETCYLSSFSKNKELKASFALSEEGATQEFKNLLELEIAGFSVAAKGKVRG